MDVVMLTYEISDYQRWQGVFLDRRGMRQGAGLEDLAVFRDHAAPNTVVAFFQAAEAARAMALIRSPELREAMQEAGIQGPPRFRFLEEVAAEPLDRATREAATPFLLVIHRVRDFDAWKPHFDAHQSSRRTAELTDVGVWRGMLDPHEVAILFQAGDLAKAQAFATSEDLARVMQEAGVEGPPEVHFLDVLTLTQKRARPQTEHRPSP